MHLERPQKIYFGTSYIPRERLADIYNYIVDCAGSNDSADIWICDNPELSSVDLSSMNDIANYFSPFGKGYAITYKQNLVTYNTKSF